MSEDEHTSIEQSRSVTSRSRSTSPEGERPPLPPRPSNLSIFRGASGGPAQRPTTRGSLLSTATTAISLTDVNTNARHDGTREFRASAINRTTSATSVRSRRSITHVGTGKTSDAGDTSSVNSYMPNDSPHDVASLLDHGVGLENELEDPKDIYNVLDTESHFEDEKVDFTKEFGNIGRIEPDRSNEGGMYNGIASSSTNYSKRLFFNIGDRRRNTSLFSLPRESLFTPDMETRVSSRAT